MPYAFLLYTSLHIGVRYIHEYKSLALVKEVYICARVASVRVYIKEGEEVVVEVVRKGQKREENQVACVCI